MADMKKKELKKCGVCGDHALGSNFNAITCESCKAFFRRNALKPKEFKCPFNNNCSVDVITRRFCQKCRLKKCFQIGMKKEWIMTDDEKKAKRSKIEKNRLKKSIQQPDTFSNDVAIIKVESPDPALSNILMSPASSMSPMTPQTPSSLISEPQKTRIYTHQPLTPSDYEYSPPSKVLLVDNSDDVENDNIPCGQSASPISTFSSPIHRYSEEILSRNSSEIFNLQTTSKEMPSPGMSPSVSSVSSKENNADFQTVLDTVPKATNLEENYCGLPMSVYSKAVSIEFTELPIRDLNSDSKNLSALEKNKLQELVTANAVLKMPLACGKADPSLIDVINMTDHAIRRLIKMSKKIAAFKNLCQDDQIALLKGGCTELMILRSVMTYDPEKEVWRGPHGPKRMAIKVDILKEAKGTVYEEHKRFINSFEPHWRTNENIMLILSGIALFTPERSHILHKEVIKLEQDMYYYLLRRYLESIYDTCEAKFNYLKLIHKIEELHILNENHVQVYLNVDPKEVEPLLIEIFDLNH